MVIVDSYKWIIFINVIFLAVSCNTNRELKESIQIEVLNSNVNSIDMQEVESIRYKNEKERSVANNIIYFKISNNSKKRYLMILNPMQTEYMSNSLYKETSNMEVTAYKEGALLYQINDVSKNYIPYIHERNSNMDSIEKKYNSDLFQIQEVHKNLKDIGYNFTRGIEFSKKVYNFSFVLNPNESKLFAFSLRLPIDREMNSFNRIISYFKFRNNQNYTFNLVYRNDSIAVREVMPPKQIEELRNQKISIFNGELISNSIPIKFISP